MKYATHRKSTPPSALILIKRTILIDRRTRRAHSARSERKRGISGELLSGLQLNVINVISRGIQQGKRRTWHTKGWGGSIFICPDCHHHPPTTRAVRHVQNYVIELDKLYSISLVFSPPFLSFHNIASSLNWINDNMAAINAAPAWMTPFPWAAAGCCYIRIAELTTVSCCCCRFCR